MLNENTYVYLETSAVNFLLDNFSFEELATIKDACHKADNILFSNKSKNKNKKIKK